MRLRVTLLLLAVAALTIGPAARGVPTPAPAADLHHYFGNRHAHTKYSDGSGTPAEAYRYARERGGLDFLAITEHNHIRAESGAGDREDGILIAKTPSL